MDKHDVNAKDTMRHAPSPAEAYTTEADAVPDPEEDDLDELDDLLDEFSAASLNQNHNDASPLLPTNGPSCPPNTAATTTGKASGTTSASNTAVESGNDDGTLDDSDIDPDEFARQLEEDMKKVFGELEANPEMQKELEALGEQLMRTAQATQKDATVEEKENAANGDAENAGIDAGDAAKSQGNAAGASRSFEATIRATMERMQQSSEAATAATAAGDDDDEIFARLLATLDNNGTSDEDFSKMLLAVMQQLTNKDVLYEPMKELDDKYPAWMQENKGKISTEEMKQNEERATIVKEIVTRFEREGFSDDNVEDQEFVIDRMTKLQAAGSPPADLMSGIDDANKGEDLLTMMDSVCQQQ